MVALDPGKVPLDVAGEGVALPWLAGRAILAQARQEPQLAVTPTAALALDVDGLGVPPDYSAAVIRLTLPPELKVNVVGMARLDPQPVVVAHGARSPALEHLAVRWLADTVQQPGRNMAQLMAECAPQTLLTVDDLDGRD